MLWNFLTNCEDLLLNAKLAKVQRFSIAFNSLGIPRKHVPSFLSSCRNTSGNLEEREMLREHDLEASVFTDFSSSPKLLQLQCVKKRGHLHVSILYFIMISRSLYVNESIKKSLYVSVEVFSITVLIRNTETRKH